ncbi:hypothetical protein ACS5PN_17945 [Roseateles sp. NT4]|uniref:hypothetical protein n=1 Tax=Roseateles sp. NT4 TaxID=3453715 RepID=UPI003EE98B5E
MHQDLERRVALLLDADDDTEIDGEALWEQLCDAVAAAPDDAASRELRLRVSEAFGMRAEHLADLEALVRLQPDNLDRELDLALKQHRWSLFLSIDDGDEASEDSDEDPGETGRQAALARLMALGQRTSGDATFQLKLLQCWADSFITAPWDRLTLALRACAAHADHQGLRRQLALAWADLSGHAPDFELADGKQPMGFAVDVYGALHDAGAASRALAGIDELARQGLADAELTSVKAHLLKGLSRFDDAAEAFEQAARVHDHEAAAQADVDAAEQARENATQARQEAALCRQGRLAISSSQLEAMDDALTNWSQRLPGGEGHEALKDWQADMQQRMNDIGAEWDRARPAIREAALAPDSAAVAEMQALATKISGNLKSLLAFEPSGAQAWDGPRSEIDPRLLAFEAEVQALGLAHVAWVETPSYTRHFGALTLSGSWSTANSDATVICTAVAALQVSEVETELDDGRQLITSRGRGRNFFFGGPQIDILQVDPSLPLPRLIALHQARVALALAEQPGRAVRAWRNAADYLGGQDRQRQAKLAYRLQVGCDEAEARGVPASHPEIFVPLLRQTALDFVRQAAAERGLT